MYKVITAYYTNLENELNLAARNGWRVMFSPTSTKQGFVTVIMAQVGTILPKP